MIFHHAEKPFSELNIINLDLWQNHSQGEQAVLFTSSSGIAQFSPTISTCYTSGAMNKKTGDSSLHGHHKWHDISSKRALACT